MTETLPSDAAQPRPGESPLGALSRKITRRTTDLICIAVVVGGLFSAALTLGPASRGTESLDLSLDPTAVAFQFPPIRHRVISGDELAARAALVRDLQEAVAAGGSARVPPERPQSPQAFDEWNVLAEDLAAGWSVRQSPESPRMAAGIRTSGADSLISCWGGLREIARDEWMVWVVVPRPGDRNG